MPRVMVFLMTLITGFPPHGSAQAAPSPGDRIRVTQVGGTVLTGTLARFSRETIQLSVDSPGPVVGMPASTIEALELSLGRERSFGKYYGMTVAVSSLVGGIVGLTRASSSSSFSSSSRGAGYYRTRSAAGGLLVGYLVGIPLGAFIGSRVTAERWSPVATSGSPQSGPTILEVTGSDVGLRAGQRVRVRAADALSVEGVFGGFEGQNMLLSPTQAGQEQRVPMAGLQALWVRKRATWKGVRIGAITGAVFGIAAGVFVDKYAIDHSDCRGCKPNPLGIGLGFGVLGAGAGAVAGGLVGFLVQSWSPVWP